MTYAEISEATGIPAWEVRVLEKRALNKIRYQLSQPEFRELRLYWKEMFQESSNEDALIYHL